MKYLAITTRQWCDSMELVTKTSGVQILSRRQFLNSTEDEEASRRKNLPSYFAPSILRKMSALPGPRSRHSQMPPRMPRSLETSLTSDGKSSVTALLLPPPIYR